MMYAIKDGPRILAIPNEHAICPLCDGEVISKCGDVKIWHWAHKVNQECDDFKESESEWHRTWKEYFQEANREVLIKKYGNTHYADIKTDYGLVIECQNSSISFQKIRERESFYGEMIWIFNCQDSVDRIEKKGYSISWFAPKRNFTYCRKPVYLDFGRELFLVGEVEKDREGDIPVYIISGEFYNIKEFIDKIMQIPSRSEVMPTMDAADLSEGYYIADGKGWWKLKERYQYIINKNGEWMQR